LKLFVFKKKIFDNDAKNFRTKQICFNLKIFRNSILIL